MSETINDRPLSFGSLFAGIGGLDGCGYSQYNTYMSNQHTYCVPFTPKQLANDYTSGMTQVEIAAKYSTTQRVVCRAMRKFGIAARVAAKRNQWGGNNHAWKGVEASYKAMHLRMTKRFGQPKRCEACGTTDKRKAYDWANLTGKFDDITDYRRLCRSCHWKLDKKILNIQHMRERMLARE